MKKGDTISVLNGQGFVRYIDHMGTDQDITEAARVSYKSGSKGPEEDAKLLHYLWRNMHTSPFEMVKVKFDVKLPIFLARQWVRHRMQNMNEVSARYSQLPSEFYIPEKWRKQDTKNKQGSVEDEELCHEELSRNLRKHCDNAYLLYKAMLKDGVAREMARMVLPLNIATQFYSCWDMKNLLHFIRLRDDGHAQSEIQEYGRAIRAMVTELFPVTLAAFDRFKVKIIDTSTEDQGV